MTVPSIPYIVDEKLTASLATLLHRAAFAAHLIGHLDGSAPNELIRHLVEHVDTIVCGLSAILDTPEAVAHSCGPSLMAMTGGGS